MNIFIIPNIAAAAFFKNPPFCHRALLHVVLSISLPQFRERITTASRSWRGAIIEAEERSKSGAPAYAYQLDWATPKDGGKFGAPHASDIQLVFDNISKPGATAIGDQAQTMADIMSETFIAFARTGNPNNKLIPAWQPYSLARRQTMVFNVPPKLVDDPRGGERRIFEKVPYIQAGS